MRKLAVVLGMIVATLALMSPRAQAVPITGSISFAGGVSFDNADLTLATSVSFHDDYVTGGSGVFSTVPGGTSVTFAGFSFNTVDKTVTPPADNLWSFTYPAGGTTYYFEMTSASITSLSSSDATSAITISGAGTLHVDGYADTVGTFILTGNSAGEEGDVTFSFSQSTVAKAPEPATLLLLGGGLFGLGLLHRRGQKS